MSASDINNTNTFLARMQSNEPAPSQAGIKEREGELEEPATDLAMDSHPPRPVSPEQADPSLEEMTGANSSQDDPDDKKSSVEVAALVSMMERATLRDFSLVVKIDRATKMIQGFLEKHEPAFVRVMQFRQRGWVENKEQGDEFFSRQRERADTADAQGSLNFYSMMIKIADDMHASTGVLALTAAAGRPIKVLDICMAPGGYTEAALKYNDGAQAYGISLSEEQGGHKLHFKKDRLAGRFFGDVTMIFKEFTDQPVPQNHPDRTKFIPVRPFRSHKFDLIFCDGKVLRTHPRPTYREGQEVTRLETSQLILALQRIQESGTLVMLLHKIDSWPALEILYTFSKFADIEIFKPIRTHASRSSFYMIARDVMPQHPEAEAAVKKWKDVWWSATFGGGDGTGEKKKDPDDAHVCKVLTEFGGRLMELGRPIWTIQANALSKTSYAGDIAAAAIPEGVAPSLQEPLRPEQSSALQNTRNSVSRPSPTK